jgi:hypothetical protein
LLATKDMLISGTGHKHPMPLINYAGREIDTKGGTELGFALDRESTDIGQADFDKGSGSVRLVGRLTLDYVKVSFPQNRGRR